MPVQAIGRHIEYAIGIPADVHIGRIKRHILHLRVGLDPFQSLTDASPETFRIIDRFGIKFLVLVSVDVRLCGDFGRYGIYIVIHDGLLRQ